MARAGSIGSPPRQRKTGGVSPFRGCNVRDPRRSHWVMSGNATRIGRWLSNVRWSGTVSPQIPAVHVSLWRGSAAHLRCIAEKESPLGTVTPKSIALRENGLFSTATLKPPPLPCIDTTTGTLSFTPHSPMQPVYLPGSHAGHFSYVPFSFSTDGLHGSSSASCEEVDTSAAIGARKARPQRQVARQPQSQVANSVHGWNLR